ncbi:hypothetical protein Hdeb2414_s0004g00148191 [Helianthus debilis subsp. tardiflorus]
MFRIEQWNNLGSEAIVVQLLDQVHRLGSQRWERSLRDLVKTGTQKSVFRTTYTALPAPGLLLLC